NSSRSPVQARPSKPKPGQANPNKILPVLPLPSGAPQGAPSFFDDRAKVKRIPIFTKELFEKFVASSSAFLRPIDPGGSEVGNTYRCLDAQSLFRLSPNVHIALRLNVRRVAPRLDVLGRRFLFRSRFCLLEERFRPRRYDCRHNRGSDAAKNQLPILSYEVHNRPPGRDICPRNRKRRGRRSLSHVAACCRTGWRSCEPLRSPLWPCRRVRRAVDRRRPAPSIVRPTVTAASLSRAAALLPDRRVRVESTLPPEILLAGARHSQEVKCLAFGQAERSMPHSPMSFSASEGPRP